MAKSKAGIVLYHWVNNQLEVLLVHSGCPYWTKKDAGAWGIPKGEVNESESLEAGARREFFEETGIIIPVNETLIDLGEVRGKSGERVHIWAWEGKNNEKFVKSAGFEIEWPPGSGRKQVFPEVDRAEFFSVEQAKEKIIPAQFAFIERLLKELQ